MKLDPNQCPASLTVTTQDGRSGVHFCDNKAGHEGPHGNGRQTWTSIDQRVRVG